MVTVLEDAVFKTRSQHNTNLLKIKNSMTHIEYQGAQFLSINCTEIIPSWDYKVGNSDISSTHMSMVHVHVLDQCHDTSVNIPHGLHTPTQLFLMSSTLY